ncbi:nuclear transport factor 2 family protein [Nocardioides cynanchi]|uniref:nuclear transport factor 2 family protein n=1 Tax=Nocardioides cynanchi TaxID=2558918 RepID=UPI00178032C4|nr:nuclear transport factor 2 family protein [Nocardioides cynanchi]
MHQFVAQVATPMRDVQLWENCAMTDADQLARGILSELQRGFAAHDLAAVMRLLDDEVVVFGAAGQGLDAEHSRDYVSSMLAQDGVVRWDWDRVVPVLAEPTVVVFAVVGTVGFDDAQGQALGERSAFRLTCVAVLRDGRWRLRHFHGSVPQS